MLSDSIGKIGCSVEIGEKKPVIIYEWIIYKENWPRFDPSMVIGVQNTGWF